MKVIMKKFAEVFSSIVALALTAVPLQRRRRRRMWRGRSGDMEYFANPTRDLIDKPDTLTIEDANGKVVWGLENYKGYISADKPVPDSVNPSLWRNAQLNTQSGLLKVLDKVCQATPQK